MKYLEHQCRWRVHPVAKETEKGPERRARGSFIDIDRDPRFLMMAYWWIIGKGRSK